MEEQRRRAIAVTATLLVALVTISYVTGQSRDSIVRLVVAVVLVGILLAIPARRQ